MAEKAEAALAAPAQTLKALKSDRTTIKSAVTRFHNYLQSLKPEDYTQEILFNIESRLVKIDLQYELFCNLQRAIERYDTLIDQVHEEEQSVAFDTQYFNTIGRARRVIAAIRDQYSLNHENNLNVSRVSDASRTSNSSGSPKKSIKLPKLQFPKFNGEASDWIEFRDTFISVIHTNTDLSAIEKFQYLRSSLGGDAALVVQSCGLSADGYDAAWKLLCDRYDNVKRLLNTHLNAIINFIPIGKETAPKLRALIDTFLKHLNSLKNLNERIEHWDSFLVYIIISKLDMSIVKEWEREDNANEKSSLANMLDFLRRRAAVLEMVEMKQREKTSPFRTSTPIEKSNQVEQNKPRTLRSQSYTSTPTEHICVICNDSHFVSRCPEMNKLSIAERYDKANELKLCFNCLRTGHSRPFCRATTCRRCGKWHHTILHESSSNKIARRSEGTSSSNAVSVAADNSVDSVSYHSKQSNTCANTILPTVKLFVQDARNKTHQVRALLDTGSQSHFITKRLVRMLGIRTHKLAMQLSGINQCQTNVNESCDVQIKSRNGRFCKSIQCLALEEITGTLPPTKIDISNLNLPSYIELADPEFDRPDSIDILLGGGLVWSIIHNNTINLGPHLPVLRETTFGWVIAGEHQVQPPHINKSFVNCATLEIQEQLKQFWNLEEYEPKVVLSSEEKFCETNFVTTTIRNKSGRFIVDLPFKRNPSLLGNSLQMAQRRFLNQERKLKRNNTLYTAYKEFMQEYIDLEHMTETRIEDADEKNEASFYLPHHSVIKEDRTTTKLRVVFDGSAKTTSGLSLNDILCVGPQIQDDLISILIRFRTYKYAMTADIEKMYRQVLVNKKHCKLQKILWRKGESEPIKAYSLKTITYGSASGAYLATRCLHEAANLVESTIPDIAAIIRTDFYVDDFLSGANSIADAAQICANVSKSLDAVGFPLRKWASNNTNVIEHLIGRDTKQTYNLGKNENTNTLGLLWATKTDELSYKINITTSINGTLTKRKILSSVAQIFDPLGLIAPIIINAKILLQGLWLIKLDWDDELSDDYTKPFNRFLDNISQLPNLKVPRIAMQSNFDTLQIHGFSDASERAYGACIYLRTTHVTKFECSLLIAKTRVAPIKTQTIPRLELCGALLLARLVNKTLKSLRIAPSVFLWTDSSVVLGWLTMSPSTLKPFVSHRIAEIQTLLPNATWRHVSTKSNPADIASRGATYIELTTSQLWWKGPSWLTQCETMWPLKVFKRSSEMPEMKRVSLAVKSLEPILNFENYSTITHIERVVAFCLRFIHNAKHNKTKARREGPLTNTELEISLLKIVKIAQNTEFVNEIKALSNGNEISASSRILSLSPFIDSDGILRVGGRLTNSKFSLGKRHPALLSSKQHIAKLIMRREHIRLLHVGPQGLLYAVRDKFWITSGKSLANKIVHECMSCFRAKPRGVQTKMGNLPAVRVNISYPFENTGIDYAGPIWLKTSNTRGNKRYKAYVCVFVCLCTKAVHLDVVTSLTTNAFIACLRRFVSRRGLPRCILSDNGTNFVGANRELQELSDFLNKNRHSLSETATKHEINWQFSPPRAPHFGGIWEAAVRSMKNHLKRVVGERVLTHEDFYTFLCQVEAVLNSRPLTPLSTNPNDVTPLSPAHFLIGRSIKSLPDAHVLELPENRLSSYQRIQAMVQHFWQRWVKEYLSQLQVRTKWKKSNDQAQGIKPGTLVLIADEALPPFCWKTGRITAIHEGKDGIVRVVTVKTATSEFQRPVTKVYPLPIEEAKLDL